MASLRGIRSFVVRAFRDRTDETGEPTWRGHVSDVDTGERHAWTDPDAIGAFVESRLAADVFRDESGDESGHDAGDPSVLSDSGPNPPIGFISPAPAAFDGPVRAATAVLARPLASAPMTAPTLDSVLADILAELSSRLPAPAPPLPDPNVTFERVRERLVGLGGIRGIDDASPLGPQMLKGGRLDATVRFQLWGGTPTDVDSAMTSLQSTILDDAVLLRSAGFLRLAAVGTGVAEHVPTETSWRKTASYELLYEYHFRDSDDAQALIARIPVNADLNEANSPDRETQTVTDSMVRWDRDGAEPLVVRGPGAIGRVDVLAFVPASPTGQVALVRTSDDAAGPPSPQPDLATFVAAVTGDEPATINAAVTLPAAVFLAELSPDGTAVELGDWDADTIVDGYDGLSLALAPPMRLPRARDQFRIEYSDASGLDTDAVLYIRVNAP